jgi:aldehyde dehydrogenase (NAD+)
VKAVKQEIIRRKYAVKNKNYVQIVNDSNVDRLKKLITKEHLSFGGVVDAESRVISPTILENLPFDHPVMQEEIFGPILPVFQYNELNQAINYIKAQEKPLSAYVFSNSKNDTNRVLKELSFGGGCVNDAVMHISNPNLPFGGIGASGIGSYHGEAGFACFSHQKSILKKSNFLELPFKYAPISDRKLMWIRSLFKLD